MDVKVIWNDEREKALFEERGLGSFDSFWSMEMSGANIEYKVLTGSSKGKNFRNVSVIRFEQNIKYYLKRASGSAFRLLKNEFEALSVIGNFGFRVPRVVCYAFDELNKMGFVLVKSLAGFVCLKEILKGDFRPELIAEYRMKEEQILANLARGIILYQRAGYFYKELKSSHVYVNPLSSEVALIDLETFVGGKAVLLYNSFCVLRNFCHAAERRRLLHSIQKDNKLSARALKRAMSQVLKSGVIR